MLDPHHLGRNIKRLRRKRRLSQEELAQLANVKLSNLAKLEGGFNVNPTVTTLSSLARVLTRESTDDLLR